jgi:SAM-dependent methyltransferase
MRSLFKSSSGQKSGEQRVPRHSSGWAELYKHLCGNESLRILDVGSTSPQNINFLTTMGHSVYMANFVEDAADPEWRVSVDPADLDAVPGSTRFDIEGFLQANLNFAGRSFDVVTLWDTLDYLPVEVVAPLVDRLHQVLVPGGKLLAFFHTKLTAPDISFSRYHLGGENQVDVQKAHAYPIVQTFQNRQIERLFHDFGNYRFFLAKDNLQEVIVTR